MYGEIPPQKFLYANDSEIWFSTAAKYDKIEYNELISFDYLFTYWHCFSSSIDREVLMERTKLLTIEQQEYTAKSMISTGILNLFDSKILNIYDSYCYQLFFVPRRSVNL